MPCYRPLTGYKSLDKTANNKRTIVFSPNKGFRDLPVTVPCGQCIGCRLEKSRQWAIRIAHEASLHEKNCFITLTYAPEHLPEKGTLIKKDFQDFMKRLRKKGIDVRYFHCGEYGENFGRPHYHACLFGYNFPDLEFYETTRSGDILYKSKLLEDTWGKGLCVIGTLTFESAAYVARYVTKKVTGKAAENHYSIINTETGEIDQRQPEYTTMSRRPGIGKEWFEKYKTDVYPSDFIYIRNKKVKVKPPKYYDYLYEIDQPTQFQKIKGKRRNIGKELAKSLTPERLSVKEKIHLLKSSLLKRRYEKL